MQACIELIYAYKPAPVQRSECKPKHNEQSTCAGTFQVQIKKNFLAVLTAVSEFQNNVLVIFIHLHIVQVVCNLFQHRNQLVPNYPEFFWKLDLLLSITNNSGVDGFQKGDNTWVDPPILGNLI